MASPPTQWTWVWASSGRWWKTGKPGVLQSRGRKELDTTEQLNNSDTRLDANFLLLGIYYVCWHKGPWFGGQSSAWVLSPQVWMSSLYGSYGPRALCVWQLCMRMWFKTPRLRKNLTPQKLLQLTACNHQCVCAYLVAQSCLTLWDPMDCNLPGSSVHGILQARILEWIAMPSFRGSSWPRDWTLVSWVSCISWLILYH